jgi:SagB-type dehydrogenase family enzyme
VPAKPAPFPLDAVTAYHHATKHRFDRYAAALGYLDWATQPNPFRRFAGAARLALPREAPATPLPFGSLYDRDSVPPAPLGPESIADFLRHALALSAWKRAGASRWSLRVNPSSGNLHPTEAYLVLPAGAGFGDAGVWHYAPEDHALERRAAVNEAAWRAALAALARGAFLVGLTSIVWREAWKYGERAFRYCQHDLGHALAALRFAAVLHGWRLALLPEWPHADVAALLGLDRDADFLPAERELPQLVALVTPPGDASPPRALGAAALGLWRASAWSGKAAPLSSDHQPWPILDEVAVATEMPSAGADPPLTAGPAPPPALPGAEARAMIQRRRSAVALDGASAVELPAFARMLRMTVPGPHPPWDAWPWQPQVHLALFVHRVRGLDPGLYFLARTADAAARVRALTRKELRWEPVGAVGPDLQLFLLWPGDFREVSRAVSCHQEIAADGFFSLAMLAWFDPALRARGAWFYRQLFWETGMVGQVLYLEAEAAGARATGIGCFFDDPVHDLLGLRGTELQSLYHFTAGIPVEDTRLTTEPGYP